MWKIQSMWWFVRAVGEYKAEEWVLSHACDEGKRKCL